MGTLGATAASQVTPTSRTTQHGSRASAHLLPQPTYQATLARKSHPRLLPRRADPIPANSHFEATCIPHLRPIPTRPARICHAPQAWTRRLPVSILTGLHGSPLIPRQIPPDKSLSRMTAVARMPWLARARYALRGSRLWHAPTQRPDQFPKRATAVK